MELIEQGTATLDRSNLVKNLPPDFWGDEQQQLLAILLPILEEMALDGVEMGAEELFSLGLQFDPTLANAEAIAWARQYAGELSELVTSTNQKVVGEAVASFIETPGATMGQLTENLIRILATNTNRADMIGVTEVTRALAEGADLAYQQAGVPKALLKPPGHVRCRCWLGVRRLPDGSFVQVWHTNKDELANCRATIEVPWSSKPVVSCINLQGVIISEGKWLGKKYWKIKG